MPGGNPADNFGGMFRTIKNLFASLDLARGPVASESRPVAGTEQG
jgi:hypothetical protein